MRQERLVKRNEELAQERQEIQENFIAYLRAGFPYQLHWQHPMTGVVHEYKDIERGVAAFRSHYPEQYKVLWAIWMSPDRWRSMCEAYGIPAHRHKRYLECAVDHILLYLYHRNLSPEEVSEL